MNTITLQSTINCLPTQSGPAMSLILTISNRLLKNVFEAADTRQKQARKRSLCVINEYFEPVFNTVAATQIVFQRPAN